MNWTLPDWMPWWIQLAILMIAILFGFALLMMPFAVFGLKSRLELIEAQLDDVHAELRMLGTRLPEVARRPMRPAEQEPVTEEITPRPTPARPRPQPVPVPPVSPQAAPVFSPQVAPGFDVPRRPRDDDWPDASPFDEEEMAPRRPLRTMPPRGDQDRVPRSRSEPTLRWPPR